MASRTGTARDRAGRGFGRWLAALAATFCLASHAAAEAEAPRWTPLADTVFEHAGVDQGLPHQIATALAQDGDGVLWVGTEDGLARWDGFRFRSYRADPHDPGALPDGYVQCLHTDPQGRLWVGTSTGGLVRYDPAQDRFVRVPIAAGGAGPAHIWSIIDDGAGGLWIALVGGLAHVDPVTGTVALLRHDAQDPGSLPDDRVRPVLRTRAGALWVGTRKGVVRRDAGTAGFAAVPLPVPAGETPDIRSLFEDSAGRMWIGTSSLGAFVVEPDGATRAVHETGEADRMLETAWIFTIGEPRDGEIWLGTSGEGIVAVDAASGRTRRIRHDPARPTSLTHDRIWAFLRDRAGSFWVGTDGGISRYDPGQTALLTLFGGTGRRDGVSENDVVSVLAARDGHVWLGLGSNGVDVLDPAGVRVAALRPDPARPEAALPRARVLSLAETGDDIYLGTGRGLYRADLAGRGVARVPVAKGQPEMRVDALLADGQTLWVGSYEGGLWRYDLAGGEATAHYTRADLTDPRVSVIAPAAGGGLWIGTWNGINRLDPATGIVARLQPDREDPQSLSIGEVSTLLTDRQGRLWVGFQGGGVNVLEGGGSGGRPHIRHLGIADGLPNASVDKLLADAAGRIWVSTDGGMAVIDPLSLAVKALHRAEGVAFPGYWINSGDVASPEELLFGGVGGLTVARPERLSDWSYRPPVVVTDLRIGGRSLPPGRFEGAGGAEPLVVPPDANSLAVEFAALDYTAPARTRYAYRLEGYDPDWIETDWTRRVAAYTNLPPGRYTFRLRGTNRDGAWTEATLALPVRVLPAWYQTAWAKLGAGVLALLVLAAVVRSRTAYLRRRQSALERQVAERTAELELRTEELLAAHRQLEQIAFVDPLTGLANRRMFDEDLRKLVARAGRRHGRLALLLLDLDWFKRINDTLGHDAGDALLVAAAQRFRAAIRDSDLVARLGGDEFAILLPDPGDGDSIEGVCRRIVESFAGPIPFRDQDMRTSPSIGIAVYPDDGETQDALFKAADLALYAAKRGGRNTWRWHRAAAG